MLIMDDDGFFINQTICIVGLGLMGGSLALALRGYCNRIIGVDPSPETRILARDRKVVHQATADLAEAINQSDLVILAAPVCTNLALLEEISRVCTDRLSILDLSSTKSEIVKAMNQLPERFSALGGHPMCGKETSGLINADAKLYWDANFALSKTNRTTSGLIQLVEKMISIIGARPFWLDAETHDRWTAASSHLPYLVSAALSWVTPEEIKPMIGTGYQSASRLAASDITMMMDILRTNKDQVLTILRQYKKNIEEIEKLLNNSPDKLRVLLEDARQKYWKLIEKYPQSDVQESRFKEINTGLRPHNE